MKNDYTDLADKTAERVRRLFTSRCAISPNLLKIEASFHERFAHDEIVFRALINPITRSHEVVAVPKDWIEAVKARWFPKWLRRIFPVVMVEYRIRRFCPHIGPEHDADAVISHTRADFNGDPRPYFVAKPGVNSFRFPVPVGDGIGQEIVERDPSDTPVTFHKCDVHDIIIEWNDEHLGFIDTKPGSHNDDSIGYTVC